MYNSTVSETVVTVLVSIAQLYCYCQLYYIYRSPLILHIPSFLPKACYLNHKYLVAFNRHTLVCVSKLDKENCVVSATS